MINYDKIQLVSSASSNKLFQQGSGTFVIAAVAPLVETFTTATVAHNFGSDNLLYQVVANGGIVDGMILPWESDSGELILYASIDANNLYITGISESPAGAPAYTITYFYRILVP